MLEILIPVGSVVLILVLFISYASHAGGKMLKERNEKLSKAEKGSAKILSYKTAPLRGTGSGGQYQAYEFTLEVSSQFKSAYNTKAIWSVYPMAAPNLQEGKDVRVKIDADDPLIIYPDIPSVEYSWNSAMMGKGHK